MTAYGYMTRDANVCANATASKGSLPDGMRAATI